MISIKVDQFSGDACPCSIFFSCGDMLLDLDPNSLSSTKHYKIEVVLDAILNFVHVHHEKGLVKNMEKEYKMVTL
jgi:predicted SprT family Zn-dependent metalloprotease